MGKTKNNIRVKIISPLVIMLLISGMILAFGGYKIENNHLQEEIIGRTSEINKLFKKLLAKESRIMVAQLQFIAKDPGLISAWQSRNRTELYAIASNIFQMINVDFNVSHFYFIETDKTCFLRTHKPEVFGDEITRFTLQEAVINSKTSSGIELGPLGTFTLRVVYPWINNGELLGYLELGQEVNNLASRLKMVSGDDLIFTINKSNLKEETYKRRMQSMNKVDQWDEFPDVLVIDKSIDILPLELKNVVKKPYDKKIRGNILVDDRSLSVCAHPLEDASGSQVGNTIIVTDITDQIVATRKTVRYVGTAILLIIILILLFYYRYSGMIGDQIYTYQNQLEELVKERTRELHIALDEVKTLSGFLPICASCKQIRDDEGFWTEIESYIREHSDAEFSHGICPECAKKLYPGMDLTGKS